MSLYLQETFSFLFRSNAAPFAFSGCLEDLAISSTIPPSLPFHCCHVVFSNHAL
jgi:hypothetical protein